MLLSSSVLNANQEIWVYIGPLSWPVAALGFQSWGRFWCIPLSLSLFLIKMLPVPHLAWHEALAVAAISKLPTSDSRQPIKPSGHAPTLKLCAHNRSAFDVVSLKEALWNSPDNPPAATTSSLRRSLCGDLWLLKVIHLLPPPPNYRLCPMHFNFGTCAITIIVVIIIVIIIIITIIIIIIIIIIFIIIN